MHADRYCLSGESSRGSGILRFYPKLDAALDATACLTNARVFAIDLSPPTDGGAPKRYVVASVSALARAYGRVPQTRRHLYEIIVDSRPCCAYFDLEGPVRAGFDDDDAVFGVEEGEILARRVLDVAEGELRAAYAAQRDQNGSSGGYRPLLVERLVLASHSEVKVSYHALIKMYELTDDDAGGIVHDATRRPVHLERSTVDAKYTG